MRVPLEHFELERRQSDNALSGCAIQEGNLWVRDFITFDLQRDVLREVYEIWYGRAGGWKLARVCDGQREFYLLAFLV